MNRQEPQSPQPVRVQYYKYPRSRHWRHDLIRLGEDHHGVWLGGPRGCVVQRGDEPGLTMEDPFVQLITPDRWWSALFNVGRRMDTYVDITTVASWPDSDRVEMIDLDLDVVRLTDGTIYLDDEDEFEEHRVALGYPPRLVDSARAAAARVTIDLERGAPPFDGSAAAWLQLID